MIKRRYVHPDTGDVLNFSEQISWKIQGLIRNWYFVSVWSVATFVWWAQPTWFTDTHTYVKWMNVASWLAVTVELIIGIAMIGQTKRDAQILRATRKALVQIDEMLVEMRALLKDVKKLEEKEIEHLEDILENQAEEDGKV